MTAFIIVCLKAFILLVFLLKDKVNSLPNKQLTQELDEQKRTHYLRVASLAKEPFMWTNKDGRTAKGIEFELLQIIAKKEHSKLSIKNQFNQFKDLR